MNDKKPNLRFDVEQKILDCWHVVDDLKIVFENVVEKDSNPDQVSNILLGMYELYQIKFEKLFETFEKFSAETQAKAPFETTQESRKNSEGFFYKNGIDAF